MVAMVLEPDCRPMGACPSSDRQKPGFLEKPGFFADGLPKRVYSFVFVSSLSCVSERYIGRCR